MLRVMWGKTSEEWVSREAYEREQHHNSELLAHYDELLDKYHELKLSGAAIPEPPKTLERPEFDPVMAAITAKAGPDRKLRAMMAREAMRSRQAEVPDMEIIRAIEQGVTIDDDAGIVL